MHPPYACSSQRGTRLRLLVGITLLALPPVLLWGDNNGPAWWKARGVQNENVQANDYAAVNQGQLKNLATAAVAEFDAKLQEGAGDDLENLISAWRIPNPSHNDYAAVNLGQLKTVAKPFYDRLNDLGYTTTYPWENSNRTLNDYAIANIGQVKNLFAFELTPPAVPSDVLVTTGSSRENEIAWTNNSAGDIVFTVERSTDGQTWQQLGAITGITTYTDTSAPSNGISMYRVLAAIPIVPGSTTRNNSAASKAAAQDPNGDADGDGLSNQQEADCGTNPEEKDTDGDNVIDGQDAVPTKETMTVTAAPESNYALIDLGATDTVGFPVGVNDKAQVLLSSTCGASVWNNGSNVIVSSTSVYPLYGPLQDGSVYYGNTQSYDGYRELKRWPTAISAGTAWASIGHSFREANWEETGIDDLKDDVSTSINTLLGENAGPILKSKFLSALTTSVDAITQDPHFFKAWIDVEWNAGISSINDVGNAVFNGYLGLSTNEATDSYPSYNLYYGGVGNVHITGWVNTNDSTTGVFGWDWDGGAVYQIIDYETDDITIWTEHGDEDSQPPIDQVRLINNDGFAVTSKAAISDGALVNIPSCKDVFDLTTKETQEGPYILGKDMDGATTLWCYNGENIDNFKLSENSSVSGGSVAGRLISKHLVIPLGDQIWRNGRLRSVADLCGPAAALWSNIHTSQISPDNNIIIATGTQTKLANGSSGDNKLHTLLLLPVELQTRDPDGGKIEQSGGVVAPADPRPEVEMKLTSAEINAQGALVVTVTGTVKDRLSEALSTDSGRVKQVKFTANGTELDSFTLQYGQRELPFTKANSENSFEKTFTIPSPRPGSYLFKAETEANAAGNKGWDCVAVGIDVEPIAQEANDPNQLSIAFPQGISDSTTDTGYVYFGNREPAGGDGTVTEYDPNSYSFTGNVKVSGQNAPCTVKIRGPVSLTEQNRDVLEAEVRYTPQGQSEQVITGGWVETSSNSRRFYPDGYIIRGEKLVVNSTAELPGSQKNSFEPLVMKVGILEEWASAEGFKFKVNGVEHTLKKFTYNGVEGTYVVRNASDDRPKVFIPSLKPLPAEHEVTDASEDGNTIEWTMELGGKEYTLASTLVVAGADDEESEAASQSASSPMARMMMAAAAAQTQTASEGDWQAPGDTITKEDVITAYKFIYPDEFSQQLLSTYLAEGHLITPRDVLGDYDFSYWLRTDGKIEISIENDDSDMHPGIAAQYLWMGLNKALTVYSFRSAVQAAAGNDAVEIQALQAWRTQAGAAACETGVAAANMYLAAIGIVNEGADWALVVNDVSEGHYVALAAALPFVPHALVGAGKKLQILSKTGKVLEEFTDVAKLQAVRKLTFEGGEIRTMGVTMEESLFNTYLRKVMTSNGGPVPVPSSHKGLYKAMLKSGAKPSGYKVNAHHDFPWAERIWFARHGIDVNNPAFGRWVSEKDHQLWHGSGRFNDFWKGVINEEKGRATPFTIEELLNKLSECRSTFPVTNGN